MKVYIKNDTCTFDYPDEMKKILDYLNEHGKIMVKDSTIESLYRDFSEECYCAGWLIVNEQTLEEFADWLADVDI